MTAYVDIDVGGYGNTLREHTERLRDLHRSIELVDGNCRQRLAFSLVAFCIALVYLLATVVYGTETRYWFQDFFKTIVNNPNMSVVAALFGVAGYLYYSYSELRIRRSAFNFDLWIASRNLEVVTKRVSEVLDRVQISQLARVDLELVISEAEQLIRIVKRSRHSEIWSHYEYEQREEGRD